MINGNEYSYEDIKIKMLGGDVIGVTAIEYNVEQEHVNIMARGREPVAMGRGGKKYDAKITLLQSEVESIQALLPSGSDLTDILPFEITVCYAPDGAPLKTDQLLKCRIRKMPKGMKSGDGNMPVELELIPLKIMYNV